MTLRIWTMTVLAAGMLMFSVQAAESEEETTSQVVKVAAGQVELNTDKTMDIVVDYIHRAGKEKAHLIVFGEYILGPFYTDSSAGITRIAEAARQEHIYVIIGGWQEFEQGAFSARTKGTFANTALVFGRDGKIIGRYNKTHAAVGGPPHFWPPKGDENEWLMKPGEGYPVFKLDFATVGIMTCYDGYFAESALSLSLQGAEIVAWINGRGSAIEDYIVKTDMFRDYCAMIATNFPRGAGTMIGTWPNRILAHAPEHENRYISAELDLAALRNQRKNSRVFHQRRPEIYGEIVRPHQPWAVYEEKEE